MTEARKRKQSSGTPPPGDHLSFPAPPPTRSLPPPFLLLRSLRPCSSLPSPLWLRGWRGWKCRGIASIRVTPAGPLSLPRLPSFLPPHSHLLHTSPLLPSPPSPRRVGARRVFSVSVAKLFSAKKYSQERECGGGQGK